MKVDLSQLKVKDEVVFGNRNRGIVKEIHFLEGCYRPYVISFKDGTSDTFKPDGTSYDGVYLDDDIVEIIPQETVTITYKNPSGIFNPITQK